LLGVGGLLLPERRYPAERNRADHRQRNGYDYANHFDYGTTIVSPAFSGMSCSEFLPLIASL
jgi:hypothetical protein